MPSANIARKTDAGSATDRKLPAGGSVRGAEALLRAAAGSEPAVARLNWSEQQVSPRDRKNAKKIGRILKEAQEAFDTRRNKAAEALFDEAIALMDEPPPRLWCYRLIAASKAANYGYVVDNYRRIRALALREEEQVLVDRAWLDCLIAGGFFQEALREAEMLSSRRTSSSASIRSSLGVVHARLGNLDKAIEIQKSILDMEPSHILARWNLAYHQLEAGHLPEAFENYEVRWKWRDFPSERRSFDIPRWQGEGLKGKRILVWREQGVGDEIRFSGILPDLIATGARITFECSPKLVALFRVSFPDIDIRAELPAARRRPRDYEGFNFETPIGSLARRFRPTAAEMQARCAPWLRRDPVIENKVRADMNAAPHQPVIGLSWRSSSQNLQRNRHYIAGDYLTPLKLLGKSKFLCVQYDDCGDEVVSMRGLGLPIYDFPGIDQMNDLVSASYLLGACDLVISAGTAVAELSAGLGVPTILFAPGPCHIQLGTDGVPWHPSSRFLPLDADAPLGIAKSVLLDWKEIADWAAQASTSGRSIDWRLSFPGAA